MSILQKVSPFLFVLPDFGNYIYEFDHFGMFEDVHNKIWKSVRRLNISNHSHLKLYEIIDLALSTVKQKCNFK